MAELLTYALDDGVATITMDDGKANALSTTMLAELHAALDRAEADDAAVVLAGRPERFSGGFDLTILDQGDDDTLTMLRQGFGLAARLLVHPAPVVAACTGHAVAMGLFLLTAVDYRVGAAGPYRITANEVAVGLTLPHSVIELCRHRLPPVHLHRALALAEVYTPDGAIEAGFLDEVAPPANVVAVATARARELAALDRAAHVEVKRRIRGPVVDAVRGAIEAEFGV